MGIHKEAEQSQKPGISTPNMAALHKLRAIISEHEKLDRGIAPSKTPLKSIMIVPKRAIIVLFIWAIIMHSYISISAKKLIGEVDPIDEILINASSSILTFYAAFIILMCMARRIHLTHELKKVARMMNA